MKNSAFSLRLAGGLSACFLAFSLIQSNAETITTDGGRPELGSVTTADTFSDAKAAAKQMKTVQKKMEKMKTPKSPKAPKAPKATKQKKMKQQKQKKAK